MKKFLFAIAVILAAVLAACAANIEIPEEPEESFTAAEFQQVLNGTKSAPKGYFHGFANRSSKLAVTSFFHPKTGEYQGDIAINVAFAFDGEVGYIGAWYQTPNVVAEDCEITAVVTRAESLDKLKVVATCMAPESGGSSQLVYYLTATGMGNLIRSEE